jgi:hypothetical protein
MDAGPSKSLYSTNRITGDEIVYSAASVFHLIKINENNV